MTSVIAAVVLYQPPPTLAQTIAALAPITRDVLLIDNSDDACFSLNALSGLAHAFSLHLIRNGKNEGVARALNTGCRYAQEHGYEWILTMDQDSIFDVSTAPELLDYSQKAAPHVAIISPYHETPGAGNARAKKEVETIRMTMTSGNLLRLASYQACGPFEEKLFIDSVDHEYCLRLRKNGFEIVRLNRVRLRHSLGQIHYTCFLFTRWKTTNHSPIRRYYMARNRWFVMTRYFSFDPKFFRREVSHYLRDYFRILFFERQKRKKIAALLRGTWHFIIGKYGPLRTAKS